MNKDTAEVKNLMKLYEQNIRTSPTTDIPPEEAVSRAMMIVEEVLEYVEAAGLVTNLPKKSELEMGYDPFAKPDMVEIADGLVDIIVTAKGGFFTYGIDGDRIFHDVIMPSNFAKAQEVDGVMKVVKKNGKTQKPQGWEPPDVRADLIQQGWKADE